MNANKKKLILIIIPIIIIAVIFLFGKNNKNKIVEATSFFLSNAEGKEALFNKDGKQLTDFIFEYTYSFDDGASFSNGTALVSNGDEYGIIKQNGKMLVDFGEYDDIDTIGKIYEVRDKDDNYFLMDTNGKILFKDYSSASGTIGDNLFVQVKSDKYISVITSTGKLVTTFNRVEDEKVSFSSEDDYGVASYSGKVVVFNDKTGKVLTEFDDDKNFCISSLSEDGKIMILNSCVSWYEKQETVEYKLIKNGKLIDTEGECDSLGYNGNVICYYDTKGYLLDSNNKRGDILYGKNAYIDGKNYIIDDNVIGVDFYKDGKLLKNVNAQEHKGKGSYFSDMALEEKGYMKNGLALLTNYYDNTRHYEIYNFDGEKINDKIYIKVKWFDDNGFAIVSEIENQEYLLDEKGNQVGLVYDDIWGNEYDTYNYYITEKDDKVGILTSNGDEIISPLYEDADIYKIGSKFYAKLKDGDSKYIIYDLLSNKELSTFDSEPRMNNNYISIKVDGKTYYYTYSGKKFFEN